MTIRARSPTTFAKFANFKLFKLFAARLPYPRTTVNHHDRLHPYPPSSRLLTSSTLVLAVLPSCRLAVLTLARPVLRFDNQRCASLAAILFPGSEPLLGVARNGPKS